LKYPEAEEATDYLESEELSVLEKHFTINPISLEQ
jgi:hypothetical protein